MKAHILLITGTPGIGKTTVLRRVADELPARSLRGFYTAEIREGGERQGFRLTAFGAAGEEEERAIAPVTIAHVAFPKTHRVGKYGVDLEALQAATALLAPDETARVYLVDEIGKMECLSDAFVTAMRDLLKRDAPVVATIGLHGGGFIEEAKAMAGVELWHVTRNNRDTLPAQILAWLADRERGKQPS